MQNLYYKKSPRKSLVLVAFSALMFSGLSVNLALAHGTYDEQTGYDYEFYDQLNASPEIPKGMTKEYIERTAKRTGVEVDELMSLAEGDICENKEFEPVCAYFGNEAVYKVRNYAWQLKSAGASDQEVLEQIAPILEIGFSKNVSKIYGEEGMPDEDVDEKSKTEKSSILVCGGLKTAIDQQSIPSTNPVYGRDYRLVTCAAGLNWRWAWSFLWWDYSVQTGIVLTHSRFSRHVLGFWHLTGADNHICSTANAMGNSQTKCNDFSWNSPVTARANFLWNQPAGAVVARGHAHKLGHNFNTQINF